MPFAWLLVLIAVMPFADKAGRFWHRNRNKLLVSLAMSLPVLAYYWLAHPSEIVQTAGRQVLLLAGWQVTAHMLHGAIAGQYIPFIMVLVALYVISGGIMLRGDLLARPRTNTIILGIGAVLANLIGTTGAAMLLIRPLLNTNSQRKHIRHTVIFFIIIVCNTGGCLTPMGDPPLFLGFLEGVPFFWTLRLAGQWAMCNAMLLGMYYIWDSIAYRKESKADAIMEKFVFTKLSLHGKINFIYLVGVILAVVLLVPGTRLPAGGPMVPDMYLREAALLSLALLSLATTRRYIRDANKFSHGPLAEVAALFIGIFITMQAPIEILHARGQELGLTAPWQFFWATGTLSGLLDNAPTYAVFFETARSLASSPGPGCVNLLGDGSIRGDLLAAVSAGAVFMGAMTYIGNGPNFMVKAIAEERQVKMPGFFGYMAYSVCILVPVLVLVTLAFFR
jgi:Na+/H+ antiporter NhaD/arsenite permease-like protein